MDDLNIVPPSAYPQPIILTEPSITAPVKTAIRISRSPSLTRQTAWRAGAAVHVIQYDTEYKRFVQKRAKGSGEAVARACVAKEPAKIVYYILKNKSQYKGFKGQPIIRQKSQQWPRVQSPFA